MKMAMRPRYYCDFCKKGNGSASAMKRHESSCTLNPNRVCRMCSLAESAPVSLAVLLHTLDTEGFSAMRELCNGCPACTLAAIRARSGFDEETGLYIAGPDDGRNDWSYSADKKQWWDEYNSSHAEVY